MPISFSLQMIVAKAAIVVLVYFLAAEFTGMYRSWRGASLERELLCVLGTWLLALAILLPLALWLRVHHEWTARSTLFWILSAPAAMSAGRLIFRSALRWLRAQGINTRGFAILGVTELGMQLARNVEKSPDLGLRLVGFFDDRPAERLPELPAELGRKIGGLDQLIEQAERGEVGTIYITFPMRAEKRIQSVLGRLVNTTANVYVVPDFFMFELLQARWTDINGLPVVSVLDHPFYGVHGLLKRTSDLLIAGLALTLLAVTMAVIALLVKFSSPGPVFFRQRRYGLDGQEILVWKFRSMRVCENGPVVQQATKEDPRVTPIGRILRRTSLDELPQLFNVLGGSMSLVGPRPHANAHNEQYRKLIHGYMLRHKVKPGITGLAQVRGFRGETDTLEKMEGRVACDLEYIQRWSLWLDLKIILETFRVVLSRQNAY